MRIDEYPTELRKFIQGQIDAGEFSSVDEFALSAAELYLQSKEKHALLCERVQAAIDEFDAGGGTDISDPQARRIVEEDQDRGPCPHGQQG